jgi:peptidoglycan/xylan/chitin deacetylase (PgdA/CDA1 family)
MLARRMIRMGNTKPIISFTFDDFPRSALHVGGAILKAEGAVGTYYASFGLMGGTAPTGVIFTESDLETLLEDEHELGCHTFEHCEALRFALHKYCAVCGCGRG